MARGATARLYDVDEDTVEFKKFGRSENYDHGSIKFQARKGSLIDLDQLHESIWATRLSGGTRSGLVSLVVTAVGTVEFGDKQTMLKVADSDAEFELATNPDDEHRSAFNELRAALGDSQKVVTVTGRLDGWQGRWPTVLAELPRKPRCILVTDFEIADSNEE